MSADLLAEFGQAESAASEDLKDSRELDHIPLKQNEALIPNVAGTFKHAALGGEREDHPENLWRTDDSGADVLFDASTDQGDPDDEFGAFEDAQEVAQDRPTNLLDEMVPENTSAIPAKQAQSISALARSIDSPHSTIGKKSHFHDDEWGEYSVVETNEERKKETVGFHAGESYPGIEATINKTKGMEEPATLGDGREADVTPDTLDIQRSVSRGSHKKRSHSGSQPQDASSSDKAPTVPFKDEARPTNVPPPAILLQILPEVFRHLDDGSHAAEPIQGYTAILQAYNVSSHLIAGRTLRWKRDSILSQNTKIGPAAAGRKGGGMKLAAINKSETLKEEREVADVLRAWERHAHYFNATLHKAAIRRPLMTLCESLKPRPAKGAGVMTSTYACALCGLKRDERVPESDVNVDDSFGEFWIEHWGHRDCKDFWYKHQALLPHR